MDVGLSTASYFNKLPIEDAVVDIGAHGVRVCELFLNSFSEYEPEFVAMLAERVLSANLSVYSVHPMGIQFEPLLFSQHVRQREDSFKIYEHVLSCCRTLGATHYVMHGAAYLSGVPGTVPYARLASLFAELIAMAKAYGVTLTLENVSWCLFNRPEVALRLLDAIGDDTLKFTLDVKQALRVGLTALDFIEAIGDNIENVHLCDADMEKDGAFSMRMPGQGGIDFAAIRDALLLHNYMGPVFIEVYGNMYDDIAALYESVSAMQRVFTNI